MEVVGEFERTIINNVGVIVWKHHRRLTRGAATKRKNLKERVGLSNLDVPMLDMRMVNNELEFCDFTITVDDVILWKEAIVEFYSQLLGYAFVKHRRVKDGNKVTILDKTKVQATFTIFSNTKVIMVQPGDYKEKNLMATLKQIPDIIEVCDFLSMSSKDRSFKEEPTAEQLTVKLPPLSQQSSKCVNQEKQKAQHCTATGSEAESLTTERPRSVTPHSTKSDNQNTPKEKHSDKTVHVNEILCFIQNKSRSLPLDMVTKLCIDFYNAAEIRKAKRELYDLTESSLPSSLRFLKRSGEHKARNDVKDIVKVFSSLESGDIPKFSALDLGNLPPLNAFDNDVIGLHKEIGDIKASLGLIIECRNDIAKLTFDLKHLKSMPTLSQVNHHDSIDASRTPSQANQHDSIDALHTPSQANHIDGINAVREPSQANHHNGMDAPHRSHVSEATSNETFASVLKKKKDEDPSSPGHSASEASGGIQPGEQRKTSESSDVSLWEIIESIGESDSDSSDQEEGDDTETVSSVSTENTVILHGYANVPNHRAQWPQHERTSSSNGHTKNQPDDWTKIKHRHRQVRSTPHNPQQKQHSDRSPSRKRRRSRRNSVPATGSFSNLKAVKITRNQRRHDDYDHRTITGVFISKLDTRTSCAHVATHVCNELGFTVRPEKLLSRCGRYSSFYIRCDKKLRNCLLDPNLWPQGSTMKPYFG